MLPYKRDSLSSPRVILLDGLWGSGKSLLAPIVSTLDGVSPFRIESQPEVITHMLARNRLTDNVFKFLFLNSVIERSYAASIGREVNLRIWDDSSYFQTLGLWEILKRLASKSSVRDFPDGLARPEAYFQLTHLLTQSAESLLRVLPGLVTVINIQRNPAFLFSHWEKYLRHWDRERELTLAVEFQEAKVPFFAEQWAEEWVSLSLAERSALAVARCASYERNALARIGNPRESVYTVYFEDLLTAPEKVLLRLSGNLEKEFSSATKRKVDRLAQNSGHRRNKLRPEGIEGARDVVLNKIRNTTSAEVYEEFYHSVREFEDSKSSHGEVTE